jgi:hypothetical protein
VTRNCEKASTDAAGNSSSRWARITLVSSTKPWRPGASRSGRDHARQYAGDLDDGDRVLAAEGIDTANWTMKFSDLLATMRKGVRRVQPHRHQQRLHLAVEEARHPAALFGVALGVVEDDDAPAASAGITSSLKTW